MELSDNEKSMLQVCMLCIFVLYNQLRQAECYPHSQVVKGDKAVCIKFCARMIELVIKYHKQ